MSFETFLDIRLFKKEFVAGKRVNKILLQNYFVVFLSTRSLKIVNRYIYFGENPDVIENKKFDN